LPKKMPGSESLFKNWPDLPLKVNIIAFGLRTRLYHPFIIYLKILIKFIRK
jgi:hypothetical protein